MDKSRALTTIARTTFRPFERVEWETYAGVNSENPLIGESHEYVIIIDGDIVEFIDTMDENLEDNQTSFQITII